MPSGKLIQTVLVGTSAAIFAAAHVAPHPTASGPVLTAAIDFVSPKSALASPVSETRSGTAIAEVTRAAVDAFSGVVRPLSRPVALESAFKSYFAYKAVHPEKVQKPYLYFVDYGLPSTAKRGYLFDMSTLTIVDGPFMVAQGRGSQENQYGVPTRFSNASNSFATSLGLYVAQSTYDFHGHMGGSEYTSVGLRLDGVSSGFNDNALARRVVAHGAPYVTPTRAGRSQGCPAMEPARAQRLLPKLADGGMVFLFAPDPEWLANDPWISAAN
ncbi:hypothetical protein BH09GEM1_BH09GEM1_22940 [soil metagenome]